MALWQSLARHLLDTGHCLRNAKMPRFEPKLSEQADPICPPRHTVAESLDGTF
jgi:hypothetical protein